MEGSAFNEILGILPQELKVVLLLFVFIVLFYPRLADFIGHFMPHQRAIRKARQRQELEALGIAPEPHEAQAVPAVPPPEPEPDREAAADGVPTPAGGLAGRFERLRHPRLTWCFAGAFLAHALISLVAQFQAAAHFAQATGSDLPYLMIAPNVLIFGAVYGLGAAVLGVMFFGNRGRWGNFLLGVVLAVALWMLQFAIQRLTFAW